MGARGDHARGRSTARTRPAPSAAGWTGSTDCGVPAITGVDTRALVRHIRDAGRCAAACSRRAMAEARGARADRGRAADGRARPRRATSRPREPTVHGDGDGPRDRRDRHRHQGLDRAQPRRPRRARRRCTRARRPPTSCSPSDPDAVFLANGPGDPAALDYVVETVRELVGKEPVWGICLGHQLLCRAVGPGDLQAARSATAAPTTRSRTCRPGAIEITSQNHGFAVARPRRRAHDRRRRAGALGDRLRRGRAVPREPLRPHGRGPGAARRARRRPSSTTPRPARARTTPCTCSTAS